MPMASKKRSKTGGRSLQTGPDRHPLTSRSCPDSSQGDPSEKRSFQLGEKAMREAQAQWEAELEIKSQRK